MPRPTRSAVAPAQSLLALSLLALLALTACSGSSYRPAPAYETQTGVHGTVGVGVNSRKGLVTNTDLTLSVCRQPRPVTLGVGVNSRTVDLEARC
ncbi:hypothetical protein PSM7751_04214 [Pseudooceanicola marinus]|uniref:Lipoprotein n=1 Tax=Pseudooceanicola marinus TaxID=396013 RepID=A0A1X7AAY7_9RHOB|nr:hypothetical protein [Pseudooceanicola marinus]SLN74840.1 hypothetical protein PSM7751_04214 [Pseudooceanicola marinus]